jgi:hypothetical protein
VQRVATELLWYLLTSPVVHAALAGLFARVMQRVIATKPAEVHDKVMKNHNPDSADVRPVEDQ